MPCGPPPGAVQHRSPHAVQGSGQARHL